MAAPPRQALYWDIIWESLANRLSSVTWVSEFLSKWIHTLSPAPSPATCLGIKGQNCRLGLWNHSHPDKGVGSSHFCQVGCSDFLCLGLWYSRRKWPCCGNVVLYCFYFFSFYLVSCWLTTAFATVNRPSMQSSSFLGVIGSWHWKGIHQLRASTQGEERTHFKCLLLQKTPG